MNQIISKEIKTSSSQENYTNNWQGEEYINSPFGICTIWPVILVFSCQILIPGWTNNATEKWVSLFKEKLPMEDVQTKLSWILFFKCDFPSDLFFWTTISFLLNFSIIPKKKD